MSRNNGMMKMGSTSPSVPQLQKQNAQTAESFQCFIRNRAEGLDFNPPIATNFYH